MLDSDVPSYVPHQEMNASSDEALSCVVVRSGQEGFLRDKGFWMV